MSDLIFVFGTLKEGFCNFHVNEGRRVPGVFVTRQPRPLYVIGPRHLPWLLDRPGEGEPVRGQVFEVDDAALARMDLLERVDDPLWYERRRIEVQALDGGTPLHTWVYFGSERGFAGQELHAGPMAEYTLELEQRLRPRAT